MSMFSPAGLLRKFRAATKIPAYFWYHKIVFGITNTKFDISFTVFRESFIRDQYQIKDFLRKLDDKTEIFFLDLGRNHGFILVYMLYFIIKNKMNVKKVTYIGVDPSPIKFAYLPAAKMAGIEVEYHLVNRAVILEDGPQEVRFKYGERNLGNFNIAGSNFEKKMSGVRDLEFIEIGVETVTLDALMARAAALWGDCAAIVKIDCKIRTEEIFLRFLEALKGRERPYLVACEADGSAGDAAAPYRRAGGATLCASNLALS